jgi:hypothetical protein
MNFLQNDLADPETSEGCIIFSFHFQALRPPPVDSHCPYESFARIRKFRGAACGIPILFN